MIRIISIFFILLIIMIVIWQYRDIGDIDFIGKMLFTSIILYVKMQLLLVTTSVMKATVLIGLLSTKISRL